MDAHERDGFHLVRIAETIADLDRRLRDMDMNRFLSDPDEQALTAFRLSIIGENANKLSDDIKARHPDVPWTAMYSFRNVVSHEYHRINPERAWDALESLSKISEMVREEQLRLDLHRAREERAQRDRDGGRDR